ncbi:peroxidase family protein [Nitrosomonas marina]|uniref:Animal haem peroxidase n=1 Tax=Nitrosomonas marina TaxID=917 RepID=A0A1H8ANT7_9PROT|nr:peroxidase family protein [Nitrosomonas marina]SEM72176.1 Animal haem peroxidase [Nitrosomonas marina]
MTIISDVNTNDSEYKALLAEVIRLLESGEHKAALEHLHHLCPTKMNGDGNALLGLVYFRNEAYEMAAKYYEAALKTQPGSDEWRDMLARARANMVAEIQRPVPPVHFFERDTLLAPAIITQKKLPEPIQPGITPAILKRIRYILGNSIGILATGIMNGMTLLWGTLAGYRDRIWTNWYRRGIFLGILTLAYMRECLNKNNLKTTYPADKLVGFQPKHQKPPDGVTHFRTADGTWNNLADPKEGAAGTRFHRNVANSAILPESGDRLMTPNPREISRLLLTRSESMKEIPFLNLLAAAWIQFQNHDWISHGENVFWEYHKIPLSEHDPARTKYRQTYMYVPKTQPDPTHTAGKEQTPITFINEVTHWWDGSQIYGSDQKTADFLRSGMNGKLRINKDGTLPVNNNGIEETGFTRNWWVGLAMLHNLFVLEHNAICDHLKSAYPKWSDDRLYNVARLINAAVIAKIHSVEWTPAILPNRCLDIALNANWFGILTNLFRSERNRKTVADINVRNPELGGVVGNPIDKHNSPYGLTEEFVEVYRMHSLLPESLTLRTISNERPIETIPIAETRQAGSSKITQRIALADLFYSFGKMHPGQLVLNNYPKFMQEMSIPGNPLFDLGAVDLLRARERGVPRYNEFRRQLGLSPINTFEDLTDNKEHVRTICSLYGNDVELLDLMIGTLAEGHRPTGFGFGETMFQIFMLNATRRLQADRFYTDDYNPRVYTQEGLLWIDTTDFKTVLLRHYPELGQTGLANINNAFEPWDTEIPLDPERHPLHSLS